MNKSGKVVAKENLVKLSSFLEANQGALPRLRDGTLNKSAIARLAGLDRQMFRDNPGALPLLHQYGSTNGQARASVGPGVSAVEAEARRKLSAEVSDLRHKVAARELELTKLRSEVLALRRHKALHDAMVESLRHIKPPPPSA